MGAMLRMPNMAAEWDAPRRPIKIDGVDEIRPAFLRAGGLAVVVVWITLGVGLLLSATRALVVPSFLFAVSIFGVGISLTLLSVAGLFSTFAHRQLGAKQELVYDTLRHLNEKYGWNLSPDELRVPLTRRAVKILEFRPAESAEWIGNHRTLQVFRAMSGLVRWNMERVALITLVLALGAVVSLVLAPWISAGGPLAVGSLVYIGIFASWAMIEVYSFVFRTLQLVHDPAMILESVHDGAETYTLVTWPYRGEVVH